MKTQNSARTIISEIYGNSKLILANRASIVFVPMMLWRL